MKNKDILDRQKLREFITRNVKISAQTERKLYRSGTWVYRKKKKTEEKKKKSICSKEGTNEGKIKSFIFKILYLLTLSKRQKIYFP